MRWCSLVLLCALVPACSFVFVRDHQPARAVQPGPPVRPACTTTRALPIADLAIGAVLGGLVAATTNSFIEQANEDCPGCHGKGPVLLAAFLVVSPWWISSLVGFSDTGRCRAAHRAGGLSP